MKTIYTLFLAITFSIATFGQSAKVYTKESCARAPKLSPIENPSVPGDKSTNSRNTKSTSAISTVTVGQSVNVFGKFYPFQSLLDYDYHTNTLLHLFRGDNVSTTGNFATGNDVVAAYSQDLGLTWEKQILVLGTATERSRYPSGAMYNPAGNTDPNNLFSVVSGPVTNGAAWVKNYYGSAQYDGSNIHRDALDNIVTDESFNEGTAVLNDGNAFVGSVDYKNGIINLMQGYKGPTDTYYNWNRRDIDIKRALVPDGAGEYNMFSSFRSAFNEDGSVGYMWVTGADARNTAGSSFVPIVYKSVDHGDTWDLAQFVDFGAFPCVRDSLIEYDTILHLAAPAFQQAYKAEDGNHYVTTEMEGVVDAEGDLHLFSAVCSATSVDPTDLWHFWTVGDAPEPGYLYEFEYNLASGIWMAFPIRQMVGSYTGFDVSLAGFEFGHRIQASINNTGDKVVCSWTDTDPVQWSMTAPYYNLYPDIYVWGRDLTTNMHFDPKIMTLTEEIWGNCLLYNAAHDLINGTGSVIIPASIAELTGANGDSPIKINYIHGLEILDEWFVITSTRDNGLTGNSVSAFYPNPSKVDTKLDINLTKAENVSLQISSVSGQIVKNLNLGTLNSGSQTINVKVNDLKSGIYVANITIGQQVISKKLVIQ